MFTKCLLHPLSKANVTNQISILLPFQRDHASRQAAGAFEAASSWERHVEHQTPTNSAFWQCRIYIHLINLLNQNVTNKYIQKVPHTSPFPKKSQLSSFLSPESSLLNLIKPEKEMMRHFISFHRLQLRLQTLPQNIPEKHDMITALNSPTYIFARTSRRAHGKEQFTYHERQRTSANKNELLPLRPPPQNE